MRLRHTLIQREQEAEEQLIHKWSMIIVQVGVICIMLALIIRISL